MCGLCCIAYSVVLSFPEWLNMVKNHGFDCTISGLDKLFIKRNDDGSCIFLYNFLGAHLCGLQHDKPNACKLWPFKILNLQKYGYEKEAAYNYMGRRLYIYADSTCAGLNYGHPNSDFATHTLREFVEVALGIRRNQLKTTANIFL